MDGIKRTEAQRPERGAERRDGNNYFVGINESDQFLGIVVSRFKAITKFSIAATDINFIDLAKIGPEPSHRGSGRHPLGLK